MKNPRERILLVENDPDISDLIARQTLQSLGYRVEICREAAAGIQEAVRLSPDLIITDLDLPGLSGKDLLVALNAQGFNMPIIILAQKGMEADVIQSFRLGASDYLLWPAREAEIVSAVERAIRQVRNQRERETLSRQLKRTNEELQRRVRELTTIFALGKAVTSITSQRSLFDKIIEGATYIAEADSGWLLVREDKGKAFFLAAQRNLPKAAANRLNQPWDDGISSLVAVSKESLSIHGEPLSRFKVSQIGKSALVVPVKAKGEIIGLLVVMRRAPRPFSPSDQALMEAVTDYASIAIMNARLFRALEERIRSFQQAAEKAENEEIHRTEQLHKGIKEVRIPLNASLETIRKLIIEESARLNATQKGVLRSIEENLERAAGALNPLENR